MKDASLAGQPLWLRILQFPLTRIIVLGYALVYFMEWAQSWLNDYHNSPMPSMAIQIVLGLAAIGLYVAWGKFIERREVTELSTPGLGREWAIGALCGAGLYTASAVVLMLLGIYKVEGLNPWLFLLPNLAMAIKSGIFEELIFRGVLFRSVESMFGSWVGILVSSLAFGLLHLLNPGATLAGPYTSASRRGCYCPRHISSPAASGSAWVSTWHGTTSSRRSFPASYRAPSTIPVC